MERLRFDHSTGDLIWVKPNSRNVKPGDIAGCVCPSQGYRLIGLKNKHYLGHRLAWMLYTGAWPVGQIDHINGCRSDNRIINLRDVGQIENGRNQRMPSSNTSGVVGVSWCKSKRKWSARIKVDRKQKNLGYFDSLDEAAKVRKKSEKHFGFHENHGKPALNSEVAESAD